MIDIKSLEFFKDVNLAYAFDPLTGVLTREMILNYFKYLLSKKIKFTLCLCDIDNFKDINDFYGHMAGDEILHVFATEVSNVVGNEGLVGRYGGDEFMVILPEIDEYDKVWEVCHSINVRLGTIRFEKYKTLVVTTTMGVTRCPIDGVTYTNLLETADKALYRGKTKGRNCFIIYLASKHANIEVKTEKNIHDLTTELIASIFEIMSNEAGTLRTNIEDSIEYMVKYMHIDCISLDSLDKMCFCYVNSQSEHKNFNFIESRLYEHEINSIGLTYINSRKTLLETNAKELFERLKEENVMALLAMKLSVNDKVYGFIIARNTKNKIWQSREIDLFVMVAKVIARAIYYNKTTLEEVFK